MDQTFDKDNGGCQENSRDTGGCKNKVEKEAGQAAMD